MNVRLGSRTGLLGRGAIFHQNTPTVLDACEAGDRFGSTLTAADYDGNGLDDLSVAVPGENLTTANESGQLVIVEDAGAVAVLYGWRGLMNQSNQLWSQRSSGVPGTPEAGDNFGAGRYGHMR